MRFRLVESKEDKQRFIDKFGKEVFDDFWSSRQLLKNKGVNADITWHTKYTDVDTMNKLLQLLADERQNKIDVEGERIPEPNGNYDVVYQDNEWTVYHPKDYISSIHCAQGARWCTAGGYDIPKGEVKVSQAKHYFGDYTSRGVKLFYYIKSDGNKYAVASYMDGTYKIFDSNDKIIDAIPNAPTIEGIPDVGLYIIEEYVFDGYNPPIDSQKEHIKKIEIANGVTKLVSHLFAECVNLKSVSIPSSVTSIGWGTFGCCRSLTEILIPDSVGCICNYAFSGCDNLRRVIIRGKDTEVWEDAFDNDKLAEICCPKDSYAERYAIENNIPVKYI
jgi:hypothetical protein